MQCACAVLPSVACPPLPYFCTLSHKRRDFRKEVTEHKIRVLIFSTTFVWNISRSKKNWARYDHRCTYIGLHVKCRLCMSDFNETWLLPTDFPKILRYEISWKSVRWETNCSIRTERHMTNLTVAFRNPANAPKIVGCLRYIAWVSNPLPPAYKHIT
jgi:hypothetical protein